MFKHLDTILLIIITVGAVIDTTFIIVDHKYMFKKFFKRIFKVKRTYRKKPKLKVITERVGNE